MRLSLPLDDVFETRSHVRVLRALDGLPLGFPASVRDIARRAGISHPAASRVLASFASQGVVLSHHYGRSDMYELNPQHVLYETLRRIFRKERKVKDELLAFLRREIKTRAPRVKQALLFGSAARDEMNESSDIDLAIVAPRESHEQIEQAIAEIAQRARGRFGGHINALVATASLQELTRPRRPGRDLWRRIAREGVPLLPGPAGAG